MKNPPDTSSKLSRRQALAGLGGLALTAAVNPLSAQESAEALLGNATPGTTGTLTFPRKADFSIPEGTAYLNAGSIHPIPRVVVDSVQRTMMMRNSAATQVNPVGRPDPRVMFAELINAKPKEVAHVPNTSTGENLVVNGLGLDRNFDGNVVTDSLHYDSALLHLLELGKRGLDVRVVQAKNGRIDMKDMERVVDNKTRLIEVSGVCTYNGFQHDLKAVCDLAHAHGAYVYADIIHHVGAVPLDVRATGLDFAACSGFKWLMADFGLGFLYVREDLLERVIRRSQYGYFQGSVEAHNAPHDPEKAPITWSLRRDTPSYFEVGTIGGSAAGAYAYHASLPYIKQLGVENIQAHRQPLLRKLEAELPRLGYPLLSTPGSTSPLITFAVTDSQAVQRKLAAAKVTARVSRYWVRFAPSVYNDMKDIEQAIEALS